MSSNRSSLTLDEGLDDEFIRLGGLADGYRGSTLHLLDGGQTSRRFDGLTRRLGQRYGNDVDDKNKGVTLHDASLRGTTLGVIAVRAGHHDEYSVALMLSNKTLSESRNHLGQWEVSGSATLIGRVEFLASTSVDTDIIHFEGGVLVDLFACALLEDFGLGFSNS